jgi:predicted anti-sigma-YlaC factor YlaD
MNCVEVKDLLSHYHDGELSPDDRERVAAHLENCTGCSSELARFRELTGMMQRMPAPVPSALGWDQFEAQLADNATVEVAKRVKQFKQPTRSRWLSFQGVRPLIAVAALLLVAVGWFAVETWFGNASHDLLAADIRQYVEEFERDPQAAQRELLAKYKGESVGLAEAVRQVSYQPAAARGLPPAYSVDSMHVLRMPCCDCLQTVCQRGDGSKFVIFEYGEEHPTSVAERPSGMAHCRGENCCLVQINDQFAMSWKQGERHISVVGVRDEDEMNQLAAWFN